jgi:hypothetical protein
MQAYVEGAIKGTSHGKLLIRNHDMLVSHGQVICRRTRGMYILEEPKVYSRAIENHMRELYRVISDKKVWYHDTTKLAIHRIKEGARA